MRRNYISPEYRYRQVFGSLNMEEESSFFGSKMLEIEDKISITDDNLIYYQLESNEQLDEKTEKTLPEIVYEASVDKSSNHKLSLDLNQTEEEKKGKAKWMLKINLKKILSNYLFATLKKNRTFEGVRNQMVISNNVNTALSEYISRNVYFRYKFVRVEMFLLHEEISYGENLQLTNNFDQFIEDNITKLNSFQTRLNPDESEVDILFSQTENAEEYCFRYYFNIYFEKL